MIIDKSDKPEEKILEPESWAEVCNYSVSRPIVDQFKELGLQRTQDNHCLPDIVQRLQSKGQEEDFQISFHY